SCHLAWKSVTGCGFLSSRIPAQGDQINFTGGNKEMEWHGIMWMKRKRKHRT
ncbi:unnamed protein product, partial [Musa acuminata subsp. burmannicoides]